MKIKAPISETRIDPKNAIPKEILEQYPWHWDPMEPNHTDDTHFMKNVDFDWKGLGDWAIKKCNEHLMGSFEVTLILNFVAIKKMRGLICKILRLSS